MAMSYYDALLDDTTPGNPRKDFTNPGYTIEWSVNTDVPQTGIKTINISVKWNNLRASKTFSLSMQKSNL
jgi:hypothetical protein